MKALTDNELEIVLKHIKENPEFYHALFAADFLRETIHERKAHEDFEKDLQAFTDSPIWKMNAKAPAGQQYRQTIYKWLGGVPEKSPLTFNPTQGQLSMLRKLKVLLKHAKRDSRNQYEFFNDKIERLLKFGAHGVNYNEAAEAGFMRHVKEVGAREQIKKAAVGEQLEFSAAVMKFLYDNNKELKPLAEGYKQSLAKSKEVGEWSKIPKQSPDPDTIARRWESYMKFEANVLRMCKDPNTKTSTYMRALIDYIIFINNYINNSPRVALWDGRVLGLLHRSIGGIVEAMNRNSRNDEMAVIMALAEVDQVRRQTFIDYFTEQNSFAASRNGLFALNLTARTAATVNAGVEINVGDQHISSKIYGIPFASSDSDAPSCSLKLNQATGKYELSPAQILADLVKIDIKKIPGAKRVATKNLNNGKTGERIALELSPDLLKNGLTFEVSITDDNGKPIHTDVTMQGFAKLAISSTPLEIEKGKKVLDEHGSIVGYQYTLDLASFGIDENAAIELSGMTDIKFLENGTLTFIHKIDPLPENLNFLGDPNADTIEHALVCSITPQKGEKFTSTQIVIALPTDELDRGAPLHPSLYLSLPRQDICAALLSDRRELQWTVATPTVIPQPQDAARKKVTEPNMAIINNVCEAAATISSYVAIEAATFTLRANKLTIDGLKNMHKEKIDIVNELRDAIAKASLHDQKDYAKDLALAHEQAKILLDAIVKQEPEYTPSVSHAPRPPPR